MKAEATPIPPRVICIYNQCDPEMLDLIEMCKDDPAMRVNYIELADEIPFENLLRAKTALSFACPDDLASLYAEIDYGGRKEI